MAATVADICNLALSRVGHTDFIDDLDEETEGGRLCSLLYPLSRDAVLASFQWRFATRRADLAVLAEGNERNGWGYTFVLPSDCVLAGPIWNGFDPALTSMAPTEWEFFDGWSVPGHVPYELEDDATYGRVLLANQETVSLSYVSNETNVSRYPAAFVQAVAWHLAGELALGLSKKPDAAARAAQAYAQSLATAKASELNQSQAAADARPSSITARD